MEYIKTEKNIFNNLKLYKQQLFYISVFDKKFIISIIQKIFPDFEYSDIFYKYIIHKIKINYRN